jgi:hypothetical protein
VLEVTDVCKVSGASGGDGFTSRWDGLAVTLFVTFRSKRLRVQLAGLSIAADITTRYYTVKASTAMIDPCTLQI